MVDEGLIWQHPRGPGETQRKVGARIQREVRHGRHKDSEGGGGGEGGGFSVASTGEGGGEELKEAEGSWARAGQTTDFAR